MKFIRYIAVMASVIILRAQDADGGLDINHTAIIKPAGSIEANHYEAKGILTCPHYAGIEIEFAIMLETYCNTDKIAFVRIAEIKADSHLSDKSLLSHPAVTSVIENAEYIAQRKIEPIIAKRFAEKHYIDTSTSNTIFPPLNEWNIQNFKFSKIN